MTIGKNKFKNPIIVLSKRPIDVTIPCFGPRRGSRRYLLIYGAFLMPSFFSFESGSGYLEAHSKERTFQRPFLKTATSDLDWFYPVRGRKFVSAVVAFVLFPFHRMSPEEYRQILGNIKHCILATDLALFFPNKARLSSVLRDNAFSWSLPDHR